MTSHWNKVELALRYVKGAHTTVITCGSNKSVNPVVYDDSDCSDCRLNRKTIEVYEFPIVG